MSSWVQRIPLKELPVEPEQTEARVLSVERDVPAGLVNICFHIGGRKDVDFFVTDLLSDVLSNGQSSRLTQTLIKDQRLFSDVNAYISGDVDPGLMTVTGRLMPGVGMEQAEKAIWDQLRAIVDEGVTPYELEKVKNKIVSNLVFSEISFLNKAMNLAQYELLGDVQEINREVDHYQAVTRDQMQTLAGRIFTPENSSTLYYRSTKN